MPHYYLNNPWPGWVAATTTNTGYYQPTLTSATACWDSWWQANQTGTSSLQLTQAWSSWVDQPNPKPRRAPKPTPAQIRNRAIQATRARVRRLRERVAERRAEALLLEHLTPAQREQWTADQSFTVHTADGERTYRIRRGRAGNITLIRNSGVEAQPGRWLRRYCFHEYHPDGMVPVADNVLAQKLVIEHNEEFFLAQANLA